MHGFGMWGMGPWMWLGWILILGAIIWVVYATTRKSTQSPHSVRELTSQEILERRYARGDISSEEYEERKRILYSSPALFTSEGRCMRKSAPPPGASSTVTRPECASTIAFTSESPSPTPSPAVRAESAL